MSDAVPQIPLIEAYPVTGDSGAVTVQAGSVLSGSRTLAGQGAQITAISSTIAPSWSGEAATNYQALAGRVVGAFSRAATALEDAALLMIRYARELERLQALARTAAQQSTHWHEQIVTWTGKVNDAQTAVTNAQTDLTSAQGQYTAAIAAGPKGAAAVAQAGAAITRARTALTHAHDDLNRARTQLTHAHEQFTHWQQRAKTIHTESTTLGEELAGALLLITIIPPPLPQGLDLPALEPTPRILLNDSAGEGEGGKGGKGGDGGGKGEGADKPPKIKVVVGPDGKLVPPPRPKTKPVIGDPKQELGKAGRQLEQGRNARGKETPLILLGRLITGLIHLPPKG